MFSKFAGAVTATLKSNPSIEYSRIALHTLQQNADKPASLRVLRALLNNYFVESKSRTKTRTHSDLANECVKIIDETTSPNEAIEKVIAKLNSIPQINEDGHFATLLNIYFSAFQEYLPDCNQTITNAATNGDTWQNLRKDHINFWIKKFMQDYLQGKELNHHRLAEVAAIIPAALAQEYHDFLMEELLHTYRKEDVKGLHDGWAHIAMGKIAPHLTEDKRNTAILTLTTALNESESTSIIGAGHALAHLEDFIPARQYKKAADQLYLYAIQNLNELLPLYEDDQNEAAYQYATSLFAALKRFGAQYAPEQKKGITDILLKDKKTSYLLRTGMQILGDWMPDKKSNHDFISSIPKSSEISAEEKLALYTTLPDWVEAANNNGVWSPFFDLKRDLLSFFRGRSGRFSTRDELIAKALTLRLLMKDPNETSLREQTECIKYLATCISPDNYLSNADSLRCELYQVIGILSSWADSKTSATLAQNLYAYSTDSNSITYRIYAAEAALAFSAQLTPDQVFTLRDVIITGLDHPQCAAAARRILTEYARAEATPQEELPALMSCLLAKHSFDARVLLGELDKQHDSILQAALSEEKRAAVRM